METKTNPFRTLQPRLHTASMWPLLAAVGLCLCAVTSASAATATIYATDFEGYPNVATSWADAVDADPTGVEWNLADDTAVDPTTAGAGVQVQNWLVHGGTNALLLRGGTEADIFFNGARSGSKYQLDFWLYVHKTTGDRSFRFTLQGEGADNNGSDYIAYNSVQSASRAIRYYDGVANNNAGYWSNTVALHVEDTWQHHRIVIDSAALKMNVFIDDMANAVIANVDLARCEVAVPTILRIYHEGNSADDGYIAVDDLSFTVDGSRELAPKFTDGFESYPARTGTGDDADPLEPWITTETDGTGTGRALAPAKVQVVDSTVVTPHSGDKCLKIEAGQRAGSSFAWGVAQQTDIQVNWWARVPASATGGDYNYLRMSLYGAEGGNTYAGDCALLGYGCRSSSVGTSTSLTYYTNSPGWMVTGVDFTPDTWEEYRLLTHASAGQYSIIKNPSSANPQVVVDHVSFIGSAANWGPFFMVGWSSSNGTNHPPVYVDDVEVRANQSPTAVVDTVARPNQVGVKVAAATLAGNDTDPESDTLTVTAVSATSAQGGTVSLSGGWVFYTPPAGNPLTDTYTYTVSDGWGGSATGTVTVERSPATIYATDFEGYPNVATSLADTADADPTGVEWNLADDTAVDPTTVGAGVQVQNWLVHGGTNALLLRGGTEADIFFNGARSGPKYQLDFWLYVHKTTGDRSFRFTLQGEGADNNGGDYIAYNSVQSASRAIRYYDGVANNNAGYWSNTVALHVEDTWQHHRIVIDSAALKMNVFIDDMANAVIANVDLARCEVAVPTILRIYHEGNSADDGYIAVDDLSFTVDGSRELAPKFTDGFESYPARTGTGDDADPLEPWITTETDGTGTGRALAPAKVQVVDSTVVTPHSGDKCLKIEAGQRAGSSFAWGVAQQTDIQVNWWARVPASATGGDYNYLRMSLYGAEGGNTYAGDCALLGYGCRSSSVGTSTSLTYYTNSPGWMVTGVDFTPDTWEEYRLLTHASAGQYSIIKNPSSANPQVVVDHVSFIGSAANWGPFFMVGWSSSNGTNHPPVYVDDVEVRANQSPTAVVDTVARPNQVGVKVAAATLAGNDTDPESDTLTVTAVSATSAQGGTVSLSGGWVFYTPPAGNPLTDTYTYTVSDGWGGSATGTVTLNRAPAGESPTQTITGVSTNGDGTVTISFAGIANQTYVIEAATNLASPVWVPIGTNPAGANGLFQFTDPNAAAYPSRFYRTATP